jgi:hypothetical protein
MACTCGSQHLTAGFCGSRGWCEEGTEARDGECHDHSAEDGQEAERLPEGANRLGADHYAAGDLVEVGERQQVGDPADSGHDRAEREDQPGQEHLRQHGHDGELDGLSLVLGDAGYQHADAEGDEHEQQRAQSEHGG